MRIRAKSMAFGRMLVFLLMVLSAITGILGSTFAASAVGPACTLNPTSGVVGTTITVSCTGFTADETVQVWWDGVNSTIMAYASFTADTNGAGSASFKAPSMAGGTHTVIARGGVSATQASTTFTTNPRVVITPTSGKVGTLATITLSGYAANDTAMVNWSADGVTFVPLGAAFTISSLGAATVFRNIPDAVTGAHIVKVTATTTPAQTTTFTALASLALSTTSGKVGSLVTVTLRGYGANEAVNLTWAGTTQTSLTTNAIGFGSASLTIPETVKGIYTIAGSGTVHTSAATYTVVPSVTLSTSGGKVGSNVTATFKGYAAGDAITVNWYKDVLTPVALSITPAVVATSQGSATATITIPNAVNGSHSVEGKTAASSASAAYTVGYDMLLTPNTGANGASVTVKLTGFKANDLVTLNWYTTSTALTALTTATASVDGSVTKAIAVPDGSTAGAHKIDATTSGASRVSQTFTVTTVAGGPDCALSQSAGPATSVTTATCTGFAPSEAVNLYWDSTATAALTTFTTSGGAGSITFTIPGGAALGAHSIISKGQSSNSSTSDAFTVTAAGGATCVAGSTTGPVGSTVSLNCSGFLPSEQIRVYWGSTAGTIVANIYASTSGAGVGSFKTPDTTGGTHAVVALGNTSKLQFATNFTVTPSMTINTTTGKVNGSFTITVKGYAANESVTVNWSNDGTSFFPLGTLTTTNAVGTAMLTRNVPPARAGSHAIAVTADTTPTANTSFSVTPSITINATQVKVGATLIANMQGYDGSETIVVVFHATTVGSVTTDSNGNASLTFTVPAAPAGPYNLTGTGTTNSAFVVFTIVPNLILSSPSGKVDAIVTATLTGYAAGEVITINWYKTAVTTVTLTTTPATITADANGSATATFAVPAASNGPHTVQGKAGVRTASVTFVVSYDLILSPTSAAKGATVNVTLTGFASNSVVTVRFWNTTSTYTDLTSVTVSADGSGVATITIPATATSGSHMIAAVVAALVRTSLAFIVQ